MANGSGAGEKVEEPKETLEELLERQRRENWQKVLDLNGPGKTPKVDIRGTT